VGGATTTNHINPVFTVISFHRLTSTTYLYNGCLAWYNVHITHGSTQA